MLSQIDPGLAFDPMCKDHECFPSYARSHRNLDSQWRCGSWFRRFQQQFRVSGCGSSAWMVLGM
ncbi:hypothetical protein HanXRQr2_Chr05g0233061 [Helianthus annuus]|uniref:Uncharacterized protein n=1 Tax=Helianthus annuus TaxID=4232 RepID=A0A9K3J3X8_HELAN|nr:hypothetical protein HanXRQr2_Chr05g0233061 [Helianthus annuus]KAJ0924139.1 hypothetical protein HanPSC8_Chr05g0224811 [Helianthus annuus]